MRKLLIILFAIFCVIGVSLSYFYWPKIQHKIKPEFRPSAAEEAADLAKTRELLDQSKPDEAIKIIRKYEGFINARTETGKQWLSNLIEASTKLRNAQQLLILYEFFPSYFDNAEDSAVLVEQAYLINNKPKEFEKLRDKWKNRETIKEAWFLLDADKLLLDGKNAEAIALLKSKSFEGKNDVGRLVQLGFLTVNQNPQEAWNYFTEAVNKDPQNPILHLYRARLLEAAGKTALALTEYIAAAQTMPTNLSLRDQIGEFFLRYRQYPQALQIWQESLPAPSADYIWLKAWFWSRITVPIKFDWKSQPVPDGSLKPLIEYFINLKPGVYWDKSAFEQIPNANNFLRTQQATFWMRLIQDLKNEDEKAALELLKFNAFRTVSWNPQLELALQRILNYRATGSLQVEQAPSNPTAATQALPIPPTTAAPSSETTPKTEIQPWQTNLFEQLNTLAQSTALSTKKLEMPENLHALLMSKEAFAAAFLAAGWPEAALQLHKLPVIPANFPEWVAFGLTQAFRSNRTNEEALDFVTKQKHTEALQLLTGEILIAGNHPDAAIEKLQPLATDTSDVGYRAAWLLSLLYIDKKDFAKAKQIIQANPRLAKDTLGEETTARIALLEGNIPLADTLYNKLESKSAEAKSYLARKAFLDKDYKKAKDLTMQLLVEFPTNLLIRQNLQQIIDQENKDKSGGGTSSTPTNSVVPSELKPPPIPTNSNSEPAKSDQIKI